MTNDSRSAKSQSTNQSARPDSSPPWRTVIFKFTLGFYKNILDMEDSNQSKDHTGQWKRTGFATNA